MAYDVSSWFIDQLALKASAPKRVFTIGASDYSDRVVKWPTFKRTANQIVASKAAIELANDDGQLNFFHEKLWTMANTCSVQVGFTHPDSGDELVSIYSGDVKEVKYPKKSKCRLSLRDRLWGLGEKKVGRSDVSVVFSEQIPSDVAWTLCTCYGGLSSVQSTSNPHIDYDSFNAWAAQFSADNVVAEADYNGVKVSEAVRDLGEMTDSAIWPEGDGKLYFKRYTEPDSLDFVLTPAAIADVVIDIDGINIVNKAWVYGEYAPGSDYWQIAAFQVNTTSVNTFGLHEQVWKNKHIWYTNSAGCQNMAQRKIQNLRFPPKKFKVDTTVVGLHRQLGETLRFVDSFYSINSGTGWRFDEMTVNVDKFSVLYQMNEAIAGTAFYLDVSSLDGDDLLL